MSRIAAGLHTLRFVSIGEVKACLSRIPGQLCMMEETIQFQAPDPMEGLQAFPSFGQMGRHVRPRCWRTTKPRQRRDREHQAKSTYSNSGSSYCHHGSHPSQQSKQEYQGLLSAVSTFESHVRAAAGNNHSTLTKNASPLRGQKVDTDGLCDMSTLILTIVRNQRKNPRPLLQLPA